MLFQDFHIEAIREGEKTVTRRDWDPDYNGPNVGTVVSATTELFTPNSEADCFIEITGKRTEPLGAVTTESAQREGRYETVAEFREAFEEINGPGSWDPEKDVTVVEFEYVGRSRPTESDQNERTNGDQL